MHGFLVSGGPGVTAEIVGGANAIDEAARPVFQSKCTTCHEARSPENRSMSPEQWADTVKRMITQHGADIATPDRDRIVGYLQGMARAGQIAARITVAPNVPPGMRELRLLTDHGASSATVFEVGNVPEVAAPPAKTGAPEEALAVTLPVAINGTLAQPGERDWFRFTAKKGQRLTFNLKAQRLNAESAAYFFPTLHLLDANGRELAKNLGKYGVDPFLDYVVPADGEYRILVHDLLWRGNPASVYRLTMGELPAEGALSPQWAHPGVTMSARLIPPDAEPDDAMASPSASFTIQVPAGADGMTTVATPAGEAPILVRDLPDGGGPAGAVAAPVALPALFRGAIAHPGQTDTFSVHAARGGMALDVYAQRLQSPLHAQVTVRSSAGDIVAQRSAEGDGDFALPNAFPRPGDYTVEITDTDGKGGAGYLYCWEAVVRRASDWQLTVSPDVANISPGTSMTLLVKAGRQRRVDSPVVVTIDGLPSGVTASPAVLLPDMNEAALVLTATPTAAGGTGNLTAISGKMQPSANSGDAAASAPANGTAAPLPAAVTRRAQPVALYSVNNNLLNLPRTTLAVAVQTTKPSFTLTAANGASQLVIKDGKDITIPVTITRLDGFKGPLFVSVQGLPPGVSATQNTYNIPPDKTEAMVVLRVNRDARFFKEKPAPGTPPVRFVIAGFVGNNGTDYVPALTTAPIMVVVE